MKNTDFRIGNLLIDAKGRICEVYNLDYREGYEAHAIEGAITSLPINPIEITEEWLLKFGFEINKTPEVIEYSLIKVGFSFSIYRKIGFDIFFLSQYSEIDK